MRAIGLSIAAALALFACSAPSGAAKEEGASEFPFELVCESADTATQTAIFCLRNDTRTGDVRRVDIDKLPVSGGPTESAAEPAGTYRLVCRSATTDTRADLYCVRLNRRTGEMLLVALPKTKLIPE